MVKTLKRTSKKSHRTLLHRRKINNKLRSKKNGVSKRYSKKAVLKQKGGGDTPSISITVYIVYKKGKSKGTDDKGADDKGEPLKGTDDKGADDKGEPLKVTDDKVIGGEFTTLPTTYHDKLDFVKQMSKLDMRNIIGILYKKDEHDWLFSGLNYEYEESVIVSMWPGETQVDLDKKLRRHNKAKIQPYRMKLKKSESSLDNSESIKKAITELCGSSSSIGFPDNFFTQMKNHSHFSCWIRLQKKGYITYGAKGTGTHMLTSFVYSREGDTSKTTLELSDRDDIFSEYNKTEKIIPGKVKISDSKILITPGKKDGIKMGVDSSEAAISVNDGDVLFMPYVTTNNYDDYCSDKKRAVLVEGRNKCEQALPLNKVYDGTKFEFPGRPIRDKGTFTYRGRGAMGVRFDFSKPFDAEIGKHMLSKLEEFCDFIIASKAVELKTAYVKKNWEAEKDKNDIFRLYEYSDIQDIFNKSGEFEKFLGVITEEDFNKKKDEETAKFNSEWDSIWGVKR